MVVETVLLPKNETATFVATRAGEIRRKETTRAPMRVEFTKIVPLCFIPDTWIARAAAKGAEGRARRLACRTGCVVAAAHCILALLRILDVCVYVSAGIARINPIARESSPPDGLVFA